MPPSHQRHRRSPFKRTSFRRTSSISSSIVSITPSAIPSITASSVPVNKCSGSIIMGAQGTPEYMLCLDSVTMKGTNGMELDISERKTEARTTGMDLSHRNTSWATPLGNPSPNPHSPASPPHPNSHPETSSGIPVLGFSPISPILSPASDAGNSFSDISPASSPILIPSTPASSLSKSLFTRSKSKLHQGPFSRSRDDEGEREVKQPKPRKIRPFLRKCIHPFTLRSSSFRMVGWIEDPMVCGGSYSHGTDYAYGVGIGDARVWEEARRGGLEGVFC